MRITVGQIREEISDHIGECPETDEVLRMINRAESLIAAEERFTAQTDRIAVRQSNGRIALPREYEVAHSATIGCCPARIRNRHWEFLEAGPGLIECQCGGCKPCQIIDRGDVGLTFADLPRCGAPLFALSDRCEDDADAVIRIKGTDAHGDEIWTDTSGEEVTIASNRPEDPESPELTKNHFAKITGIIKPKTSGFVSIYWWDGQNPPEEVARLHPLDRAPCYREYSVQGGNPNAPVNLIALRRRVDLWHDDDVPLVQDPMVYVYYVQALQKEKDMANFESMRSAQYYRQRGLEQLHKVMRRNKGIHTGPLNFARHRSPATQFPNIR